MRTEFQRWVRIAVAVAGFALAGLVAGQSLVNQIQVTVDNEEETEHDHGGRVVPGAPEKRTEHLVIALENITPKTYGGVTVRYYIFGEKVAEKEKDKEITIAAKGDQSVTIGPGGTLTVTSGVAEVVYTPEHEREVGGGRYERSTTIKASGERFIGYGAQVLQSGTLLGQYFEPDDMTNHLDAPLDKAKKAKKVPPPKKAG